MDRKEERELFFKYIIDVYLQNPNFPVSSDIIYNEISRFSTVGGEHYIIDNDSLVGVQVRLNNKFKNNTKVNAFSSRDGYFWLIENREGKKDNDFFDDMYSSIKIYVAVDLDNIYRISNLLFNFMINENIVMQCKISKSMRNDALVCRVSGREAAIKVCNYLNGLNYQSKFRPNPFVFTDGNIGVAVDGRLSYNVVLSRLIEQYFKSKTNREKLAMVCCDDFNFFVKSQIDMLSGLQKKSFMDLYCIDNEEKCNSFIEICRLISKNLDNTLTLNDLLEIEKIEIKNDKRNYSKQEEDKILYVINSLSTYYSVSDMHKIIMKFIATGDYSLFTRKDDIRTVVSDNFTKEDVKNIISNLGWKAFIQTSKITYDKYGEDQLFVAIKKAFNGEGINGFTNDYSSRSLLGLVIPQELLKEVMINKLEENGMSISSISLAIMMLEEINKLEEKKNDVRK